ncbi:MAG: hypothetical protein JNL98_22720 [Bryobacterales bacterium]|nr:hypothetical protein [Bryobacterales bacterium]
MSAPWPLWQRITFRFAVVYWLCYIFLTEWRAPVVWAARQFFGITITVFPAGSGDTTFNYIQVLLLFVTAASGALLWSVTGRRTDYATLHDWFRVLLRYWLAAVLLSYGMAKVFKAQFPFPAPERLLQAYGESAPMGLLWTFMGYSRPYNLFTGLAEVIPGVLLIFRRTTTLGALLAMGVMANVVALNFCYDVPVKLLSSHLLLTAVVLVLPETKRLLDVFVRNRSAEAVHLDPPYQRPWMRKTATVLQALVLIGLLAAETYQGYVGEREWGDLAPKPALAGVYHVQEFSSNGRTYEYPETHHLAWRYFTIGRSGGAVLRMNGSLERMRLKVDTSTRLILANQGESAFTWKYTEPDATHLEVSGDLEGEHFSARLRRMNDREFPLINRGFHWISEFPFNR